MGYSGAVGTIVLDKVVFLNEQLESWMNAIVTDLGKLERDVEGSYLVKRLYQGNEADGGGCWGIDGPTGIHEGVDG